MAFALLSMSLEN